MFRLVWTLQSLPKHGFYAVLLSQWLESFRWVLLFCWPVTVNVAQYTAILHYINLQTKVGISSFSYSCECCLVWFSRLLTTRGAWLSCLLTTQSQVYEIYTRVSAFDTPTQCSTNSTIIFYYQSNRSACSRYNNAYTYHLACLLHSMHVWGGYCSPSPALPVLKF